MLLRNPYDCFVSHYLGRKDIPFRRALEDFAAFTANIEAFAGLHHAEKAIFHFEEFINNPAGTFVFLRYFGIEPDQRPYDFAALIEIMAEIDVAFFTFDPHRKLRLLNRAGENLLRQPIDKLLGRKARELGLEVFLDTPTDVPLTLTLPGGTGRWGVSRSSFREEGLPHELLVLRDLSRTLREEERIAWQRLVRVLGHELKNSLAPIKSVAGSLEDLIQREPLPHDWQEDARSGLNVIASRADSLSRFVEAYARLGRLPPPLKEMFPLAEMVQRVANLERRTKIQVQGGATISVRADAAQIEQVLINLLRNAAEASQETSGAVLVGWREIGECAEIFVRDEGHGILNSANLFVPFFTTKPEGSGIGLALSRQIAEAHNGSLTLANRVGARGAEAILRLPK